MTLLDEPGSHTEALAPPAVLPRRSRGKIIVAAKEGGAKTAGVNLN